MTSSQGDDARRIERVPPHRRSGRPRSQLLRRPWTSAHDALLASVDVYVDRLARYYDVTSTSDDADLIAKVTSEFLDSGADLDSVRRAYLDRAVARLTAPEAA
jgi:hypothetical protein